MRRAIINNSEVGVLNKALVNQMYKAMDKHKADSCVVNMATDTYAEIDLFKGTKCINWAVAVRVEKE